jgi:hypothetical protein
LCATGAFRRRGGANGKHLSDTWSPFECGEEPRGRGAPIQRAGQPAISAALTAIESAVRAPPSVYEAVVEGGRKKTASVTP